MKLDTFMENIDFVFCDNKLVPEYRDLFIRALHEGVVCTTDDDTTNKISEKLANEVNLAPLPLLARNIGNGVMVYYRAKYLLNFEYDTMHEVWAFYIDFEEVNEEGLATVPLLFMLFYNVLIETLEDYSDYTRLEPKDKPL